MAGAEDASCAGNIIVVGERGECRAGYDNHLVAQRLLSPSSTSRGLRQVSAMAAAAARQLTLLLAELATPNEGGHYRRKLTRTTIAHRHRYFLYEYRDMSLMAVIFNVSNIIKTLIYCIMM